MIQRTIRQDVKDAARKVRLRAAVDAAMIAFATKGFHDAAMADVAQRAGLSLKALYELFASKEALFVAVLAEVGKRFKGLFVAPSASDDPAKAVLDRAQQVLDLLGDNPSALRLYLRGLDGLPASMQRRGADPFADYTERFLVGLANLIHSAQQRGEPPQLDSYMVARAILAIILAEARRRLDSADTTEASGAPADIRPLIALLVSRPR